MVLHVSAQPHGMEHSKRLIIIKNIQLIINTGPTYNFRLSTKCQHTPCAVTIHDKQVTDVTTAKAAVRQYWRMYVGHTKLIVIVFKCSTSLPDKYTSNNAKNVNSSSSTRAPALAVYRLQQK